MREQLVISGIPDSIRQDSWWLDAEPAALENKAPRRETGFAISQIPSRSILALLLIIAAADTLFWNGGFGVSLPLFAACLVAAVKIKAPDKSGLRRACTILIVSAAPAIEYVQLLSFMFLVIGTALAVVSVKVPDQALRSAGGQAIGLLRHLPIAWIRLPLFALKSLTVSVYRPGYRSHFASICSNWAFPVGGAFVFSALLIEANPLLWTIDAPNLNVAEVLRRVLFWGGIALLAWPILAGDLGEVPSCPEMKINITKFGINAGSVIRSLWLFNALIALQTVLDLSIILGDTALPAGMSYAEYAHRGAYPLFAMALFAGAFALTARPYLDEAAAMRPLMYLWLGQNIVVCGSALLRLELYINVYGLTYMRIYAQIWICLVAAGLALTAWQVHRSQSNAWLLLRCAGLAGIVLYGACFVNFAKVIVDHNVTLADPDYGYLCRLNATSGIYRHVTVGETGYGDNYCRFKIPQIETWQKWGFRTWRALP
ncbi:DUF4173 domain-containing protein [uncultured Roseobacter sp.]|uniref:DUF4153 domain-containing protein n=1 Tax=uncultured Roseobacter sp. TaxID=114847 RepID=UPI002605E525|nr:DUF4173 domain-containing protein [uncultured Roseobacter sp.]